MQKPNKTKESIKFPHNKNKSSADKIKTISIKNNNEDFCKKKRKRRAISFHHKYNNNPSITRFNDSRKFIYDNDEAKKYINSVKDPNSLKLNNEEIEALFNKYMLIENEQKENREEKIIFLNESIKKDIDDYFKINIENNDPLLLFLKKEYETNTNRIGFSSRKLSVKYLNQTGIKVSHVTINKELKRLGMRYLKVVPKTNKILSNENLLTTMGVLKIVSRCIKQNISLIFVDESTILNINHNLKTWIKPGENLYCQIEPKKKLI